MTGTLEMRTLHLNNVFTRHAHVCVCVFLRKSESSHPNITCMGEGPIYVHMTYVSYPRRGQAISPICWPGPIPKAADTHHNIALSNFKNSTYCNRIDEIIHIWYRCDTEAENIGCFLFYFHFPVECRRGVVECTQLSYRYQGIDSN